MHQMNFPDRKRARRQAALDKLNATWPTPGRKTPPRRVLVERAALELGITDNTFRRRPSKTPKKRPM